MNTSTKVRGMRDLYPPEYAVIRRLEQVWTTIGSSFGYEEYEAPILESMGLYLKKTSEELIKKQSYTVVDRRGKTLLMRPELTPSLARMIAQKEQELIFPIRWQSFGQFFRYEKPQRGRTRGFYQWNLDLIGSESILADLEVLLIAQRSLSDLGLTAGDVTIRISNRRVLSDLMTRHLGINASIVPLIYPILDRLDKIGLEAGLAGLAEEGVSAPMAEKLIELMACGDWNTNPWFARLKQCLDETGVSDWFEIDLRIIRGLDYYTGLVFEAWSRDGLARALFGGGRYDGLAELAGSSRKLPAVGFAVGDVAITEVLREKGLVSDKGSVPVDVLVTVFGPDGAMDAIRAADALRSEGLRASVYPDGAKKLAKQLDYARRTEIRFVAIIGPEEASRGVVSVKDLLSGDQKSVTAEECGRWIAEL